MFKFKIGDTVRCIRHEGENGAPIHAAGVGWEYGLKFVISNITSGAEPIYWPGRGRHGVLENYLELVNEDWDS